MLTSREYLNLVQKSTAFAQGCMTPPTPAGLGRPNLGCGLTKTGACIFSVPVKLNVYLENQNES